MAVVKFSDKLISEIKDAAASTFDSRMAKANEYSFSLSQLGDYLYTEGTKEFHPAISALPTEFMEHCARIDLQRYGDIAVGVPLPMTKPKPFPRSWGQHESRRLFQSGYSNQMLSFRPNMDIPYEKEIYDALEVRRVNIAAVSKQRNEYIAGVDKVCKAFDTLAPALKAWPPLWDLVPQEYKNRHMTKVSRSSTKESTDELRNTVNLDQLTATAVAAKFIK